MHGVQAEFPGISGSRGGDRQHARRGHGGPCGDTGGWLRSPEGTRGAQAARPAGRGGGLGAARPCRAGGMRPSRLSRARGRPGASRPGPRRRWVWESCRCCAWATTRRPPLAPAPRAPHGSHSRRRFLGCFFFFSFFPVLATIQAENGVHILKPPPIEAGLRGVGEPRQLSWGRGMSPARDPPACRPWATAPKPGGAEPGVPHFGGGRGGCGRPAPSGGSRIPPLLSSPLSLSPSPSSPLGWTCPGSSRSFGSH